MIRKALGIDIGGAKTAVGMIDEYGRIEASEVMPMERTALSAYTRKLIAWIHLFFARYDVQAEKLCGVGIGARGWVDFERRELLASSLFTKMDARLRREIQVALGLPTHIDNDVNAAALAELKWGRVRKRDSFIYVNLGTGTAYGLVDNGRLIRGGRNAAGEAGMILIKQDQEPSWVELESVISGRGLSIQALKRLDGYPQTTLRPNARGEIPTRQIFAACRKGDSLAARIMDDALLPMAVTLVNTARLLDPEMFVFGGGLVDDDGWLIARIESKVRALCGAANQEWSVPMAASGIGAAAAGLLGAANLAF